MTVDELMVRLKVDQSQVAPELQSFRDKVQSAVDGGGKSFLRLKGEGESFRTLLRQIADQSPILGGALRMALNPIVGLIAGATLALNRFIAAQKEAVAQAEALARASAGGQVGILEARYADDPEKARRMQALAEAKIAAGRPVNDYLKEAGERVKKGGRFTAAELGTWNFESSKPFSEATMAEAVAMRDKAVANYERLLDDDREHRRYEARVKEWEDYYKQLDEYYDKREREEEKLATERKRLEKEIAEEAANYAANIGKTRLREQESAREYSDRYRPDVAELAAGNWFASRTARRIRWLEQGAAWQMRMGFTQGAQETIFGKGGIFELKQQLAGAGLIKQDASELLSTVIRNGVLMVEVKNAD